MTNTFVKFSFFFFNVYQQIWDWKLLAVQWNWNASGERSCLHHAPFYSLNSLSLLVRFPYTKVTHLVVGEQSIWKIWIWRTGQPKETKLGSTADITPIVEQATNPSCLWARLLISKFIIAYRVCVQSKIFHLDRWYVSEGDDTSFISLIA